MRTFSIGYKKISQHFARAIFGIGQVEHLAHPFRNLDAWTARLGFRPFGRRLAGNPRYFHALDMDPAKATQIKITQLRTAKGAIHRPLGTNDLVEQLALRVPNPNVLGTCAINVAGPVHAHSVGSLEVGLAIVHFGKELLCGQSSILFDLEGQDLFRNVFGDIKGFLIGAQDQPIGGLYVRSDGLGFALRGNVNDFPQTGQGKIDSSLSVDD